MSLHNVNTEGRNRIPGGTNLGCQNTTYGKLVTYDCYIGLGSWGLHYV